MTTAKILSWINIPKCKLYYLEQKGHIKLMKILQGNRRVKDFSKDNFVRVQIIWQFIKRGFKYLAAYKKAIDIIHNR
jgi:hypothetical protein